jgi:hypothetical protein
MQRQHPRPLDEGIVASRFGLTDAKSNRAESCAPTIDAPASAAAAISDTPVVVHDGRIPVHFDQQAFGRTRAYVLAIVVAAVLVVYLLTR